MRSHRNHACRVDTPPVAKSQNPFFFLYALGNTNHDYLYPIGPCQLLNMARQIRLVLFRRREHADFESGKDVLADNSPSGEAGKNFTPTHLSVAGLGYPLSDGVVHFWGEDKP